MTEKNGFMNQENEQSNEKMKSCSTKTKTTVTAIINGKQKEITLARTMYSMDKLKKSQQKMLEAVDSNKLLNEIFHFSTPDIFRSTGIALYDMNGDEITEETKDVLVPIETSNTYWRFTFDKVLKHVEVHTFASVEEYAQIIGTTDLFSRSHNTVERIGIAALATGDNTYKEVYELCRQTGMPGSTAMAYLGIQIKGATMLAMSIGLTDKGVSNTRRSFEEAEELYQQIRTTFTTTEAKKRYIIRAVNSVMYVGMHDFKTIINALNNIPPYEVQKAMLMDCGSKETCMAQVIQNYIKDSQPKTMPMVA